MLQRIRHRLHDFWRRILEVRADAPALLRDRMLVRSWLLGARKAQLALALCLVVGVFVVPTVTDAVGDAIFEPVTRRGGFLGLRSSVHRNPKAETLSTVLVVLYWLGSAATVGSMLWLRIPQAVRKHGERRQKQPSGMREGPYEPTMAATEMRACSYEPTMHAQDEAAAAEMREGSYEPTMHAQDEAAAGESTGSASAAGVPPAPSASADVAGERYEIAVELGRGAMGVVYRARDRVLDRHVALKELSPGLVRNESLATRFRQEARVLAQLSHANVVQVYDLLEQGDRMWIVMEFVEGGSLEDLIAARGPLPAAEVAELGAQMARALGYARRRDVVHRDFKPGNVMLTEDRVAKVMDFGLAKLLRQGPGLTQEGAILGSPSYMSPEQAGGRPVDGRADVYALGATLYEMATGRPPFVGDTVEVLTQHLTQPPRPPRELVPEFPQELETLLLALLEKNADRRMADLETIAVRLEALR